jgi:hypothetical protein
LVKKGGLAKMLECFFEHNEKIHYKFKKIISWKTKMHFDLEMALITKFYENRDFEEYLKDPLFHYHMDQLSNK